MIKKAIVTFAVLFCAHLALVLFKPALGKTTHQWQDNVVKAQTYLFKNQVDSVIVGSSLSSRIICDSIPSLMSLAFDGCSVEDGLRIIMEKKNKPQFVLIESNFFLRDGSPQLFLSQTNPLLCKIRELIPSLREKYQPICIFSHLFRKLMGNYINGEIKNKEIILNKEIERRLSEKKDSLDNIRLSNRLNTLKAMMNSLEKQGVKFVFFEMPINERLYDIENNVQTRRVVKLHFLPDQYSFLPSDTTKYLTTDGIHLGDREARIYSHYLKNQLKQNEHKKSVGVEKFK